MTDSVLHNTADRTDRVTASFIQDLMRRAIQNAIVHDGGAGTVARTSTGSAPEAPLAVGGNRKRLGTHTEM